MLRKISWFVVCAVFACAAAAAPAFAADGEKNEYDFSWLDPDKKIYVVQNRKFTKGGHLELAINGGVGFGQPYRSQTIFIPRAAYYFNETFGLSVLGGFVSNSENDDLRTLKSVAEVIPNVREMNSFVGATFMWLPFYAKLNLFNQILYFDWHFELGVASVTSTIDLNRQHRTTSPILNEGSYTGLLFGTGHKYFITKTFGARLDYTYVRYSAPLAAGQNRISSENNTEHNHFVSMGVSVNF